MEKHLYAVDLTANKNNERADRTPYHTAILSEASRERVSASTGEFTKRFSKMLHLWAYLVGLLLIGLGGLVPLCFLEPLFASFKDESTRALFAAKWPLLAVGFAVLAVGIGLMCWYKKKSALAMEDPELDEATDRLRKIGRSVELELGLPEEERMTRIDVLPFRYKTSGIKVKEVRKRMMYEPAPLSLWREDDMLCITDHDAVITVPLGDMESCTEVDVKYITNIWWKDDDPGEGAYADCAVKEDKANFNYRVRGMGEVRFRHGEDVYLLRIPSYDLDAFRRLTER